MSKILEPKCVFENIEEANRYLAEWQERLFLLDWIIMVKLHPFGELKGNSDEEILAVCDHDKSLKVAKIDIMQFDKEYDDVLIKYCAEKIIIHELLHIKLDLSRYVFDEQLNAAVYVMEHTLVEEMAKSLLMAKYDIKFDWFKNF